MVALMEAAQDAQDLQALKEDFGISSELLILIVGHIRPGNHRAEGPFLLVG